jgi:hypothetical protein
LGIVAKIPQTKYINLFAKGIRMLTYYNKIFIDEASMVTKHTALLAKYAKMSA